MQIRDDSMLLSASDLVGHLNCRHLTELDIAVATGALEKPRVWDPLLEVLWERGARHEKGFVEHLISTGKSVTIIDGVGVDDDAVARTKAAMAAGDEVIVQGAFRSQDWVGRTDILMRVDSPSDLGSWSYEVIDTKLARETKGGTVLQLCLYSELVASVQGIRPTYCYVVSPWSDYEPKKYRMDDFAAYFRRVKNGLEVAVSEQSENNIYPDPIPHCDICRWQDRCDKRRRADDHLSLVAGITKVQIDELKRHEIHTMSSLATMSTPLEWKPDRGTASSYERIREQARIQIEGRESKTLLHELFPVMTGFGLASLPEPSAGDVFFDLEGDAFAGDGGLEYLFGYAFLEDNDNLIYKSDWAFSREEEKVNFEMFIDFIVDRLKKYPDLHVYHFAPYEPAALKRLMGRYASREEDMDSFLRSKRFVDLYSVVKNCMRASVESYSIKKLEPLYGFSRDIPLSDANMALTKVHAGLELGDIEFIDQADQDVVAGYNKDDCVSTWRLRDWLEAQRAKLIGSGVVISRPEIPEGAPSEALGERREKIIGIITKLTKDVPVDVLERTVEQHASWLLANMLDWHRREEKSIWWEFFRLSDLSVEDLLGERSSLSGLSFLGIMGGTAKCPIHRYSFPVQESEMRGDEKLHNQGGAELGTVAAISFDERWIDIKKRGDSVDVHPVAVFSHVLIPTGVLTDALVRIGEHVVEYGISGDGPYQAARDLLMRIKPKIGGVPIQLEGESILDAAMRIAPKIEDGMLPIQGPPGSGKTHTGAHMICELVNNGKTVGVTATSHKVIRNLVNAVVKASNETGIQIDCILKVSDIEPDQPRLRFTKSNPDFIKSIGNSARVAGGTAWLWSLPDAESSIDVLFVDEAAQMSLANVLAVSGAAESLVLLGDPQQLDQPMKGSHPEGTDVSALHHILGEHQTIGADSGLFLSETWRLHPDICTYTSEVFYEDRLSPRPGLELQQIRSSSRINGAGLRFIAVPTEGNQSSSPEEADCLAGIVNEILAANSTWVDKHGVEQPITLQDILIIAPYNAQVFELQSRIAGARIGTVDKFQGQEAPIVIYSMTTSSYSDAPRGMEFLYSLNRLNVATSRAKCICILVASPSVFEAKCRTPRQMQLANAFCRYLELATEI